MIWPTIIRPLAQCEYRAAFRWYEGRGRGLGTAFESNVEDAIKKVASQPTNLRLCIATSAA